MIKNVLHSMLIIATGSCSVLAGQTVTFDLDTGTPKLYTGQPTPFDQTRDDVLAHFYSPSDPYAFSAQTEQSTQFHLSTFSGRFLYPNSMNGLHAMIAFDHWVNDISLDFATVDYEREVPSDIVIKAYQNSDSTLVGSAKTHGEYIGDTFPQGTLSFNSGAISFNLVEIYIPYQREGACCLLLDNVIVTIVTPTPGDMNCDGKIDFNDIDGFVAALIDPADYQSQYPKCNYFNGDINNDKHVNFDDVDGFVECLIDGQCL